MKCDVCGTGMQRQDGFILTSSEIAASERYWENQLPKHKHAMAAIKDVQSKTDFLVKQVAHYALDPTGWLVCEPCTQLFVFDRESAKQSAVRGHDRTDSGPADVQKAVRTAQPVIERLATVAEIAQPPTKSHSTRKYWQCTRCGTIIEKGDDKRQMKEFFLSAGGSLSGGLMCTGCRTWYDSGEVYSGKLDMRESDGVVAAAIADRDNTRMDTATKIWYHNGRPLAGPPMPAMHREPRWKFWKHSTGR